MQGARKMRPRPGAAAGRLACGGGDARLVSRDHCGRDRWGNVSVKVAPAPVSTPSLP